MPAAIVQLVIGIILIGVGVIFYIDRAEIAHDQDERMRGLMGKRLSGVLVRGDQSRGIAAVAIGLWVFGLISIAASIVLFARS